MKSPSPRKVGQHHGDLRDALMNAALGMLERGENDAMSLREIARSAGVSSAAPYHHFADKEALLAFVAEDGFRKLDEALEEAAATARTPRTRLAKMAARYVTFALKHRAHYRLMVGPSLGGEGGSPNLRKAAMESFLRLARAIAEVAVGRNETEVRRRAALGWSLAHGAVMLTMEGVLGPIGMGDDVVEIAKQVGQEVARIAEAD